MDKRYKLALSSKGISLDQIHKVQEKTV